MEWATGGGGVGAAGRRPFGFGKIALCYSRGEGTSAIPPRPFTDKEWRS